MSSWKTELARQPVFGRVIALPIRARNALGYYRQPLSSLVRWLFISREMSNYTYELEAINERYLVALVAHVTQISFDDALTYVREVHDDDDLRRHISDVTRRSEVGALADRDARFGRRLGWYAVARAIKPRVIVETGVDKGLGSCLLASALKRNAAEGHPGYYYGTDINPAAGYLLDAEYRQFGEILYGDSVESLRHFDSKIDLFINDSNHSAEYEALEYTAIADKLSETAVILADNAHVTDELLQFSLNHGRHFLFLRERPANHWYPGGGIGVSFRT